VNVLIVDDQAESRQLLLELLSSHGYDTLQAKDGKAALEIVRREHPQMVISDIQMPEMDGFELCERIKTDPELSNIAFVFYTAVFLEPEDERLALDMGASCFVRKPAEPEAFLAVIEPLLEQQRSGKLPVPTHPAVSPKELDRRHHKRLTDQLHQKIQELESSRRSYTTLLANLPGMVYRCRNDTDWTMEFVSEGCQRMTGYPAEALVENREVAYGQLIHPDDRERVLQEVQAGREAGRPFQIEYRIRRQDGTHIRVWEQGRCINPGATSELLEGYIADVTAWHRAEADRKRFFELSLDMLCIAGTDGYFKQLSPAWTHILGWSEAELLARPWIERVHPDDREPTEQARVMLAGGREVLAFDNRYRHKDGSYRWLSWNSMPLPEEGLLYGVARDITERIEDQQKLKRLNRALRTLSAGNRALVRITDETELLKEMCRVVVEEGGYLAAWAGYAMHDETCAIKPMAGAGIEDDFLDKLQLSWADSERGLGPGGKAIRLGATQVVQDIQREPDMAPWHEEAGRHGYAAVIALPLLSAGQPFGMLAIYGAQADQFIPEEVALLEELSGDLSYGIATLRLQAEKMHTETLLEESLLQTIQAIALTVEKRDPYTSGHQNRVAQLAAAIAMEMQLPQRQVNGIHLGAMIHDIGKIYVPAEILNRPGQLTENEFGIIKTHPDVGYEIIKDVRFPWPIAQMIRQHHERLDGSGYPLGLKGADILLEARIMAVADVVEAITSHRPYRAALGIDSGIEEILAKKGIWYDPDAVDACVRLIREGRFTFA
jgi:PAS domain S-box-containing protein/putative nucleotidyltransferase with HDIG domain